MESIYILISTLIILLIYLGYKSWKKGDDYWKERGIPYIGSKIPFVGSIWESVFFIKSSIEMYQEFYKSNPNASMIGLYNFGTPELYLKDAELIKSVLLTNFPSFQKNSMELAAGDKNSLLSLNPFVLEGEKWREARSVLTNSMSTAKLKNMSLAVRDVCSKLLDFINKEVKLNNGKYEVEAQELFSRFTSEVVASAGFGIDGQSFSKNSETVFKISKQIFEPNTWNRMKTLIQFLCPPMARFLGVPFLPKPVEDYFRGIVKDVLQTRRKTGQRGNDFLQQICDVYKAEHNDEIDEQFVACHATSFLIDGYLTSSYTLSLIMSQVAAYPDVQEKIRQEVVSILEKHKEMNYDAVNEMKYLDQVIKEGMRLLPVLTIMQKKCTQECKLVGSDGLEVTMKPGDGITMCPAAVHRDENYWQNPDQFDPDRFNDDNKNYFNKFAYLSWGGGPRACVGMRIAIIEMKAAIATIINNFSVELSSKTLFPIQLATSGFLNAAKGGVWINIKRL